MTSILRYPANLAPKARPISAVIGKFDGVHVGHARLLEEARRDSHQVIVISFYPHPLKVLRGEAAPPLLTTLHQRRELLDKFGVEKLYLIRFSPDFASWSAADFVDRILFQKLNIDRLIAGPDAAVGRGREGNVEFLKSYFEKAGRELVVVPAVVVSEGPVSSRRIREALVAGDMQAAANLLGRPFALRSRVIHGAGRGKRLGFRTANLAFGKQATPKPGVYATWAVVEGERFSSVTNVGVRPTFGGHNLTVETHILGDESEDLYGRWIEVEFVDRIRDERKFNSAEDLGAQIARDITQAKLVLKAK